MVAAGEQAQAEGCRCGQQQSHCVLQYAGSFVVHPAHSCLKFGEHDFGVPADYVDGEAGLRLREPEPDVDHLFVAFVDGDVQVVHDGGQRAVVDGLAGVVADYVEPCLGVVVEAGHQVVCDV